MPLKIVRNDITRMHTEAIVNTANTLPMVSTGCDHAIYEAAGYEELLSYRKEKIGVVPEGEVFLTPGFKLPAKFIIHAVSPCYIDGDSGEEEKLRSCYRKSLFLAKEHGIRSVAFPLIATGSFGYPKEEGMRIAVDEINAFLLGSVMDVTLVVFDTKSAVLAGKIAPDLETYIDHAYVKQAREEEYGDAYFGSVRPEAPGYADYISNVKQFEERAKRKTSGRPLFSMAKAAAEPVMPEEAVCNSCPQTEPVPDLDEEALFEELNKKLEERLLHRSDTFSEYLLYLIAEKGMTNVDVYKRAVVDKKYFSKIKNNPEFHPEKLKALCLCVGAQLNLDETKDLLARAGYALSPSDLTDIIFSFYIEQEHFDVIDIDIQLEEHGLPCIIS